MNKLTRTLTLAALLAAAPLAGALAGQGSASDAGTHIYSPSPLIVNTAGAGPNGGAATENASASLMPTPSAPQSTSVAQ